MKFKNNNWGERVLKVKDFDDDRIEVKAFTSNLVFNTKHKGEDLGRAVVMDRNKARKFAEAILKETAK
jgi:hypothetical protein